MWSEWTRILKKSIEIYYRNKDEIDLKTWLHPVHNFVTFGIFPKFQEDSNFLKTAGFDFVVFAVDWLSIPCVRKISHPSLLFCKKILLMISFHHMFLLGRIDPDIFNAIGDQESTLVSIASSWPMELGDAFLTIYIPSLSAEKTLYLKSFIWYFLRMQFRDLNTRGLVSFVPEYVLNKFDGLLLDKIPSDY